MEQGRFGMERRNKPFLGGLAARDKQRSREGNPSHRRNSINKSTNGRLGIGTSGGQNMPAQGLHCRVSQNCGKS